MGSEQPPLNSIAKTPIYPPPEDPYCAGTIPPGKCQFYNRNFYSVTAQESGAQRYHGSLTTEEAQAEIDRLLKEARGDIAHVKAMLQTHGDLIASRWAKKSIDKRGQLLCATAEFCFGEWPPGSTRQREKSPEDYFTAWFPEESKKRQTAYALWIHAKDFAEDRSKLLTLLHLRTEYPPQSWAMYDSIGCKAMFDEAMDLPYNPHCVKMFGEDYGKLVSHEAALIHTSAIMSFPRALATIKAQGAISHALRLVVDEIVSHSDPSGNSKWTDLALNMNKRGGESRWTFYEHPGLVPPSGFDTKTLLEKAKSKFNELSDDMELMQVDPEYFLNTALTFKASIGSIDPIPTAIKWNLVAMELLENRLAKLMQWNIIHYACRVLHKVFEKHRENIRPGTLLPPEVGDAMRIYRGSTDRAIDIQCQLFRNAIMHMSALKDCYAVVKEDGRYDWTLLRHPLDLGRESDRLLTIALTAEYSIKQKRLDGARWEIQLLLIKLRSIKYEKAIDEEISSLALLDELRLAQIWSQLGPFKMSPGEADMFREAKAARESRPSTPVSPANDHKVTRQHQTTDPTQNPLATRLGPLLRNFCEAPWPKDHKSPTWLDKVTESRKCLSNFWKAAREEWKAMEEAKGPIRPSMQQLLESMSFDTTPEYLEEVRKEREEGEAEIQRMQAAQVRQGSPYSTLQTTWGVADSSKMEQKSDQSQRTKIKTTGTNTSGNLGISTLSIGQGKMSQSSNEGVTATEIPVRQDSLILFRKMFSSSTGSTPGSVKWTHLVQALTDAGLVATQAPGSAVAFFQR